MSKLLAVIFAVAFAATLVLASGRELPDSMPAPIQADPDHAAAPAMSFGDVGCGHYTIWVMLQNGRFYRVDDEHAPKDEHDMQKFLAWLNGGPTDIREYDCKKLTAT